MEYINKKTKRMWKIHEILTDTTAHCFYMFEFHSVFSIQISFNILDKISLEDALSKSKNQCNR